MQLDKNKIKELVKKIIMMLEDTPIINIIIEDSYVTVTFGLESYDEYVDASYHSVSRFPQKFEEVKVDEKIFNNLLNIAVKTSSKKIYYTRSERGEITLQLKEEIITTNNTCNNSLPKELLNHLDSNKRTILAFKQTDSSNNNSVGLANIVLSCDKYYIPNASEGKYPLTLNQVLNIDKNYFDLYKLKEHDNNLIFEIINKKL